MLLSDDRALFRQATTATARYFKVDPAIVEKDYYLTLFLEQLSGRLPELLFKGGTSLSKCYRVINRFSEDLDITLTQDRVTQGQRKQVKQAIKETCDALGLILLNEADTRSRRDFNRYEIDYSPEKSSFAIKPVLLVETTYVVRSYPFETMPVTSMIGDYLASDSRQNLVQEYGLNPFPVNVQTMERTLIDKVFAVCDYYLTGNIPEHSRHIYDISRLIRFVRLDDSLASLFRKVRTDRQSGNSQCLSASDQYSITALLSEIVEQDIYKKDYDNITSHILFDGVPYDEAVIGLRTLIESGLLE